MREGKNGKRSDARRPQSCHEANACVGLFLNLIYTQTCAWPFPTLLHPVFSSPSSFLFLSGLPPLVGGLDFFACWLCLAPPGFTTRGCNPLTPKAPIMMGGALPLASVEETRIFLYEFVQQRRSPKNFLEMKLRNVLAGCRTHGL